MRKRSKYRPKPIIQDPLSYVISGMKPIAAHAEAAVELRVKNHSALLDIVQGRGTRDTVDVVVGALNVTEALARTAKLGCDWGTEIREAQDALLAMASRGVSTGRFLFTGPELTAVNLAMELHDEQLNHCSISQLEKAIAFVNQMHRCGASRKIITKPNHSNDHPTETDGTPSRQAGHAGRQAGPHRDAHREDHGSAQSRSPHGRVASKTTARHSIPN